MASTRAARESLPRAIRGDRRPAFPWLAAILLTLIAVILYSNTFSSPFFFDDFYNIIENPKVRDGTSLADFSGSRAVGYWTFALNYRIGGPTIFGFHLVNLLIHIASGILVFHLTLILQRINPSSGQAIHPGARPPGRRFVPDTEERIALFAALLFVAHPIQTQAVTYIVQRFASLAALFYLMALVAYLKFRLSSSRAGFKVPWYALALASTVLAMKTKENSFTLPLVVLLVEMVFFRPLARKRLFILFPFILTLAIIPFSLSDALWGEEMGWARQTMEISRTEYLFTQFRVIMTYFRLLLLPIHQNLDYDYPVFHSLLEPPVLLSFLVLIPWLCGGLFLCFSSRHPAPANRLAGFGILWFFLTLSVESSIIPIRDVIFEHRLYLPSVGFFLAATVAAARAAGQLPPGRFRPVIVYGTAAVLVLALSLATYQRNLVWADGLTLWQDVVEKSPGKAGPHYALGRVHTDLGLSDRAIEEYRAAIRLSPEYLWPRNSLGLELRKIGRREEAIAVFQEAIAIDPKFKEGVNNLGLLYEDLGRFEDALIQYRKAVELDPDYALGQKNLGIVLGKLGRLDEAAQAYQSAIWLRPADPQPYFGLGDVYAVGGRFEEAASAYEAGLNLRPEHLDGRYNLALALERLGRHDDARREYSRVIEMDPDFQAARTALERLGKRRPDAGN